MHSRTACAAAVMAVFALGSGAVTAQTAPHKHQRPAPAAKPGKIHKPVRITRAAHTSPLVVTPANMPTRLDTLTGDVQVLPVYRAERNLYQTTPFEAIGGVQTVSQGID